VNRAVVIGAGFGGLAAALRMRAAGLAVDVFDNQKVVGGRAGIYRTCGYTFDAGPTVITAPFLFDELFELLGKARSAYVEFRPLMPWYRIRFADGRSFDYGGTREQLIDAVRRFAPADVQGYTRLLTKVEEVYRVGFRGARGQALRLRSFHAARFAADGHAAQRSLRICVRVRIHKGRGAAARLFVSAPASGR